MKLDPGNTLATALPVAITAKTRLFQDSVSSKDKADVYQFTLSKRSSFNLSLNPSGSKSKKGLSKTSFVAGLTDQLGQVVGVARRKGNKATQTLKTTLDAGTYYIYVSQVKGTTRYDLRTSATPESVNNGFPTDGNNVVPTVDLSGNSFSVFPSGFIGRSMLSNARQFSTSFGVKNTGNIGSGSFRVSFYLSNDATISDQGLDYFLGSYSINNLAAGSSTSLTANLSLPGASSSWWLSNPGGGLPSGSIRTYYVGMIIDSVNTVAETDEINNSNQGWRVDYQDITISNPMG